MRPFARHVTRAVLAALVAATLAPPAAGSPLASDPRCATATTGTPDLQRLEGEGHVRVAPDGTATWLLGRTWAPSWSPSGRHVAYWTVPPVHVPNVGTPHVLCLARGDGSEARAVYLAEFAGEPRWDPAGRRLAFVEGTTNVPDVSTAHGRVVVLAASSGTARVVAENAWSPTWSPDGTQLAVAAYDDQGGGRVELMRPDGSQRRVLDRGLVPGALGWSPDGRRVAYTGQDAEWVDKFVVAAVDGSARAEISAEGAVSFAWAPDGSRLAWTRHGEIATAAPDGSDPRPLASGGSFAWADAGRVVFVYRDGAFLVNVDGTGLTRLFDARAILVDEVSAGEAAFTVAEETVTTLRLVRLADGLVLDLARTAPKHGVSLAARLPDGSRVVGVAPTRPGPPLPNVG